MKVKCLFFAGALLSMLSCSPAVDSNKINAPQSDDFKYGYYVPKDIEESVKELRKALSHEIEQEFKKIEHSSNLSQYHHGMGSWIRKYWLYKGSRLKKYFKEHGIIHPDHMSSIIIRAYWSSVSGKAIDLDELIQDTQKAEQAVLLPPIQGCPDGTNKDFKYLSMGTLPVGDHVEFMHMGQCLDDGQYWIYQSGSWKKATKQQTEILEHIKTLDNEAKN